MRHLVRPVLAALGLAVSPCALAQDAVPVDQARYRACIAEIDADPMAAYETGLAWQAQAGGWPAAHCTALAIVASGDYAEGAARLETNAEGAVAAGDDAEEPGRTREKTTVDGTKTADNDRDAAHHHTTPTTCFNCRAAPARARH